MCWLVSKKPSPRLSTAICFLGAKAKKVVMGKFQKKKPPIRSHLHCLHQTPAVAQQLMWLKIIMITSAGPLAAPGIQGCTDYGKILVVIYLLVVIGWLFWANGSVWSIGPPKMNLVSRFLEAGCLK